MLEGYLVKGVNHTGARQILDKVRNTEPCLSTTTNNKQHSRRLKDPTSPSRNQKLTRRRDTSLSMSNKELCPFKILISYDDLGFFVINGSGNNLHKNHAKNISARPKIPSSLMSDREKDLVRPMFNSECTIEMIQNTLFVNFDRILSKSSLRYVRDMYKLVTEYKNLPLDNNEKMRKHFQDKKYPHAMLFHPPNMHSVINMTMGYSDSGEALPSQQEYISTAQ